MISGLIVATALFLAALSASALALDIVRIHVPAQVSEPRYQDVVIRRALEVTEKEFGPWRIEILDIPLTRDRAFALMEDGGSLNVIAVPTKAEWEKHKLPVYVPIRRGILGYRLLLVNRQDLPEFAAIESLDQLRQLRAGLKAQWSITEIMEKLGFNIVKGASFEGLFQMLASQRFDYFPRGVNEVFADLAKRENLYPDMVIEPTMALFIPLPTYVFVSPKYERLHQRFSAGLNMMVNDGTLNSLFLDFHGDQLERARLADRKIFFVDDLKRPGVRELEDDGLWYRPTIN